MDEATWTKVVREMEEVIGRQIDAAYEERRRNIFIDLGLTPTTGQCPVPPQDREHGQFHH